MPRRSLPRSLRELLSFIGTGGLCYGCNLVVLYVTTGLLHLHYLPGTVVSLVLVTPLSWWLNRRLTFRSSGARAGELARFALATACNYGLVLAGMAVLIEVAGCGYLAANAIAAIVLTLLNFVVMKRSVYLGARS